MAELGPAQPQLVYSYVTILAYIHIEQIYFKFQNQSFTIFSQTFKTFKIPVQHSTPFFSKLKLSLTLIDILAECLLSLA